MSCAGALVYVVQTRESVAISVACGVVCAVYALYRVVECQDKRMYGVNNKFHLHRVVTSSRILKLVGDMS